MTNAKHEALRGAFRPRAIEPDSLFLLNAEDALAFLNQGISEGLEFVGMDGFVISDRGAYEPRQDFSNDYGHWHGTRAEFENQTRDLIRRGGEVGIRFEIVFNVLT